MKHQHAEAFCLMEYASADGNEVEFIWNSRDGVTPFTVMSRLGTELRHANWRRDRILPDFRPQPGSRIFVDWPLEEARAFYRTYAEQHWDEAQSAFATFDEFAEVMLGNWQPGSPSVRVVPDRKADDDDDDDDD